MVVPGLGLLPKVMLMTVRGGEYEHVFLGPARSGNFAAAVEVVVVFVAQKYFVQGSRRDIKNDYLYVDRLQTDRSPQGRRYGVNICECVGIDGNRENGARPSQVNGPSKMDMGA